MRPLFFAGFAALLVFPLTTLHAEDDAVLLRYKLDANDQWIYRATVSLEQKQTVNEQAIETKIENSEITVRTLEKVTDDGNLETKSENKRLKVEMEIGPLGKYEYDSASTERDKGSAIGAAVTPLYERISGAFLWATITPRGEIVATRGYEQLVKDVLADNPLAQQFAGGGSDATHRASVAQSFAEWPEKQVSPGDTWETELTVDLQKIGKVNGKTSYTFEKIVTEEGRRIAEFTTKPELSVDIDLEQNGAKIGGRLQTEKTAGTIRFDIVAGRILEKSETYTIAGTLNVSVAGQNLQIPMTQTQTVRIELLDALPE